MLIKDWKNCLEIIAYDNSALREILNPLKENLPLNYSLAHAEVRPGEITYKHRLKSSEVYCILKGEGIMYINDEAEKISSGQTIYIPPDSIQRIENTGGSELTFLCIVDPAWRAEDEEVLE